MKMQKLLNLLSFLKLFTGRIMYTYQLKDENGNVVTTITSPVELDVGTYTVTVLEGGGLGGGSGEEKPK
jgi:hypothetical protein